MGSRCVKYNWLVEILNEWTHKACIINNKLFLRISGKHFVQYPKYLQLFLKDDILRLALAISKEYLPPNGDLCCIYASSVKNNFDSLQTALDLAEVAMNG